MSTLASGATPRPTSPSTPTYTDWRAALADAVTDPTELCRLVRLPRSVAASRASDRFGLLVPRTYLARVRPGDVRDPLLLQVLPREAELDEKPQFTADPVGEAYANQGGGWLWKYQNRTLMVATGACGVHCRFCFRRHFPYPGPFGAIRRWESVLDEIAQHASIHEVILSGGDPLTLEDDLLAHLVGRVAQIPHVKRLRLHTRLPMLIPQRVTDELLAWLSKERPNNSFRISEGDSPIFAGRKSGQSPSCCSAAPKQRLATVVVVHVNHPAEIDDPVATALGKLVDAGVPVLCQSVLLRNVNDRVDVLAELYERLIDLRVMPYYLHQLDRVSGAAHFEVSETTGIELVRELRARLPGYAVPRYVREIPGRPNKVVLA